MRTPVSTYRIQITEDFDLHEAARVLPYLHELGVDWVYLSPLLAAEAHSNHGYDVSDHGRIDAARGGVSGAVGGLGGGPPARAWACWSTSCPTTSVSPAPATTRGGGRC